MEAMLIGQARGLLILAKAAKERQDTRVYFSYLMRVNALLKLVDANRSNCGEQRAA